MSTQRKVRSPVGYREALTAAMLNGAYGEEEGASFREQADAGWEGEVNGTCKQ
mgnify:CR=1 FL=1